MISVLYWSQVYMDWTPCLHITLAYTHKMNHNGPFGSIKCIYHTLYVLACSKENKHGLTVPITNLVRLVYYQNQNSWILKASKHPNASEVYPLYWHMKSKGFNKSYMHFFFSSLIFSMIWYRCLFFWTSHQNGHKISFVIV